MANLLHWRLAAFRSVTDPRARASHELARSSRDRHTLHIYFIMRTRFRYARTHQSRRRMRFDAWWTVRAAPTVLAALLRGQLRCARTIALGVLDGIGERFGGQNGRVLA